MNRIKALLHWKFKWVDLAGALLLATFGFGVVSDIRLIIRIFQEISNSAAGQFIGTVLAHLFLF